MPLYYKALVKNIKSLKSEVTEKHVTDMLKGQNIKIIAKQVVDAAWD